MRFLVPFFVLFFVSVSWVSVSSVSVSWAADRSEAGELFNRGEWTEAAREYEKVVREAPDLDTLHRLSEACIYSGNYSGARKALKKALSLDAADPYAEISLAMIRAISGKGMRGFEELMSLSGKYADDPRYWRAVGLAHLRKGNDFEAISFLERAIEKDPGDYMSYFFIGIAYEQHLDFDSAMKPYKKAVRINPDYAQAVNNLGYNYKERHYYSYAREMYERAIDLDPKRSGYYYNIGNVFNHWKMRRAAFYMHRNAIELEPGFAKAHYNVGKNYVRFGFFKEGMKHLKLYTKYWTRNLSERDVPRPKEVKELIKDLKIIIEEREEERERLLEEKRIKEAEKRRG